MFRSEKPKCKWNDEIRRKTKKIKNAGLHTHTHTHAVVGKLIAIYRTHFWACSSDKMNIQTNKQKWILWHFMSLARFNVNSFPLFHFRACIIQIDWNAYPSMAIPFESLLPIALILHFCDVCVSWIPIAKCKFQIVVPFWFGVNGPNPKC